MKVTRLFRILIVLDIILYAALYIGPYIASHWLTDEELTVLSYLGYGAAINWPVWIFDLFAVTWCIIMVGLFRFKKWARTLLLLWVGISVGLTLLSGIQINTAIDATLIDLGNFLDGSLVAMAYFSDVRSRF